MAWKHSFVLVCVILVLCITLAQCRNVFSKEFENQDGDVEFVTRGPKGRNNIFKDWIQFVEDFFEDGNWTNGGPRNFAKFIGNQVTKLFELLTRDEGFFSKK